MKTNHSDLKHNDLYSISIKLLLSKLLHQRFQSSRHTKDDLFFSQGEPDESYQVHKEDVPGLHDFRGAD